MRTSWVLGLVGAFSLAWLGGCSHPCFMTESDFTHCSNGHGLPCTVEAPGAPGHGAAIPISTVMHPEGESRPISLQECIAIALEKGRVGGTNIRVLAFDPAIVQTGLEQSLSSFDASWRTGMAWNVIDERVGGPLQSLLGNAADTDFIQTDNAVFNTGIVKPLPTGGTAGIAFRTDYQFSNLAAAVNPLYQPRLVFNLEQPLLQGAGVEINQIRSGILVARVALDQAHASFTGNVNDLLFSVEEAYWNLYFAYWNLYTTDLAMRQAFEAWRVAKILFDKKEFTIQDLALLEQQYQSFRLARLDALGGAGRSVLESERQLRFLIGLPPDDCTRLIPTDAPTTAPVCPDWQCSVNEALENRPELLIARQEIIRARLEVKRALDLTRPDLRAVASYDINGLGNRLDGAGDQTNALRSLATNDFHNWNVGLQLDVPIGFRNALAQTRRAKLQLERRLIAMKDLETQAMFSVQASYRRVVELHQRVEIQASLRKAATTQYRALYEEFRRGLGTLQFVLQAQQAWVAAMRDERATVFDYNIALADFERAKGTIMRFDNVSIAEGPVPACVQARASEHIRQRESALLLRQRPVKDGPAPHALGELDPGLAATPPSAPAMLDKAARPSDLPASLPNGAAEVTPQPRSDGKEPAKQ